VLLAQRYDTVKETAKQPKNSNVVKVAINGTRSSVILHKQ